MIAQALPKRDGDSSATLTMFFSPASDPPELVANAENLRLTSQETRFECSLEPGATYRLRALTEGGDATGRHAALIAFQSSDPVEPDQALFGLTRSDRVGPYIYLDTGPGLHRTDRIFSVPSGAKSFNLMCWANRGPCTIKTLSIEQFAQSEASLSAGTDYFLSFDLEALPGRASDDLLNRLVWGKTSEGEFGIRRICKILHEHQLRGNFLFDFSACTLNHDRTIGPVVDFLLSSSHALELHLHPEWVCRDWGLADELESRPDFDQLSYDLCRRVLGERDGALRRFGSGALRCRNVSSKEMKFGRRQPTSTTRTRRQVRLVLHDRLSLARKRPPPLRSSRERSEPLDLGRSRVRCVEVRFAAPVKRRCRGRKETNASSCSRSHRRPASTSNVADRG